MPGCEPPRLEVEASMLQLLETSADENMPLDDDLDPAFMVHCSHSIYSFILLKCRKSHVICIYFMDSF